jgi:hypothetical protein
MQSGCNGRARGRRPLPNTGNCSLRLRNYAEAQANLGAVLVRLGKYDEGYRRVPDLRYRSIHN